MNERAIDHKCPACSAPLSFKPKLGKWKCDYCDSVFTLNELQKFNNASSTEAHKTSELPKKAKQTAKKDNTKYISYRCKDCGAEIIADEQTAATFCVYCGNTAILKHKLTGEFKPTKIIPFKMEKEFAIESFKKLSKGRIFMPKTFNSDQNIEKIRGIYIPFWLYDINVSGEIVANAKNVTSWTSGNVHYTKTDNYRLYRTTSMNYIRIPCDASTRFENDIMNTIEPFDYSELVDYNHAYLSGFLAEKYDVKSEDAFKEAGSRSITTTTEVVKSDMNKYMPNEIVSNDLVAKQINLEYVLLPVYMVNVKYNNKYYTFAMNGQTGEFVGNIPLDKRKILISSLIIFTVIFILTIIISYIIYLNGVQG